MDFNLLKIPNNMKHLDYVFIKRELRYLHEMSVKGISVTNETISVELISEINHFMAVLLDMKSVFKPEFDDCPDSKKHLHL